MTQAEFGEKIGYASANSVLNLERGKGDLPISRLEKIAQVLDVPIADLIIPDDQNTDSQQKN